MWTSNLNGLLNDICSTVGPMGETTSSTMGEAPEASGILDGQCTIFTTMVADEVTQSELTLMDVNVLPSTIFTCIGDNGVGRNGRDTVEVILMGNSL